MQVETTCIQLFIVIEGVYFVVHVFYNAKACTTKQTRLGEDKKKHYNDNFQFSILTNSVIFLHLPEWIDEEWLELQWLAVRFLSGSSSSEAILWFDVNMQMMWKGIKNAMHKGIHTAFQGEIQCIEVNL